MKQRLVGALVLLSGGVVLWSLLFTGPAAYKVNRGTQIPAPPAVAEVPEFAPAKPANIPPPQPLKVAEKDIQPLDAEPVAKPEKSAETKPVAKAEPAAPRPEPKPAVVKSTADSKSPALDKDTVVPVAWVLQVASFVERANADKLKQRLQAKKYKAYVQKTSVSSGVRYRVMVGPSVSKAQAEKDLKSIARQFSLKPLLQQFQH